MIAIRLAALVNISGGELMPRRVLLFLHGHSLGL
jgi:hypothetical protein